MSDTSLDDKIGFNCPYNFLGRNDILRILNDGASHPFEMIRITSSLSLIHP